MTKSNDIYELPWVDCLWLRTALGNWYALMDGYSRAYLEKKVTEHPVGWVAASRFHKLALNEGAQLFKGKIRAKGLQL